LGGGYVYKFRASSGLLAPLTERHRWHHVRGQIQGGWHSLSRYLCQLVPGARQTQANTLNRGLCSLGIAYA
jgi:hypothetical protein